MQFEFQIQQQPKSPKKNTKILPESYQQNQYHAFATDSQSLKQAKLLQTLQDKIKKQRLLLEYQQKRKNQRLKQIEYVYTNGFNNFLWEKNRNKNKGLAPMVIINRKDLLQIDQMLPDQIQILRSIILKMSMKQVFTIQTKSCQAFLRDFYNYYPRWKTHISDIIEMQINNATKIQNAFQSQYTFPSKVLSSLKFSANVHMFCAQIFSKSLRQIVLYNQQLSLDFYHIYEPWLTKIKGSADKGQFYNLYHFITSNQKQIRNIKKIKAELCQLMNIKSTQSQKLISQMLHFSQNRQAISHLFSELSSQQLDETNINIKLAVVVWKKIIANRKKLQSILTLFIDEILNSYYIFPKQVKYIMREYYRIARKKFGQVKYQDVKSFFNKVIYSQLLFPEFMGLLEDQNSVTQNVKNFNIPIIALLSQKILFGQEFYEKAKYSYFNQLITHYSKSINDFMFNFLDEIHDQHRIDSTQKQVDPMLISFESLAFLYQNLRKSNKIEILYAIQNKVNQNTQYTFGSSTFKSKDVYLVFINKNNRNYQKIFEPKQKIKRIFIQFLLHIQKIPQPMTLPMLLEQYKYMQTNDQKQQVQILANYLSLVIQQINIEKLALQITHEIDQIKTICERVKIVLEKQYNYAQNIQKVNMNRLKQKRKFNAKSSINDYINGLMSLPTGFKYVVHDGNVCQVDSGEMVTFQKCLKDIAQFYTNKLEGYDGLYHLLLQKICQDVQEQGIVLQQTMQATQQIIGAKLYEQLGINTIRSQSDIKIHDQMLKHYFINLKLLELPQYCDQQQLIIQSSLPLLDQLQTPHSADELLKIFHEITQIFQNIILINGKASDITADVQIPMMILILTKSRIKNLASLLQFIQKFCGQEVNSSIMGQTLTLLTSVKYLIQNLNDKQFTISKEQYQSLVDQQQRRMQAQSQRSYLIIDHD